MPKIYTKVGDRGQTALLGGTKVSKGDIRIEAYGAVDELNSIIGWVRSAPTEHFNHNQIQTWLETIQHWLFDLGSLLAASVEDRVKYSLSVISDEHVCWFEKHIDLMTETLPELRQFILPAGSEIACRLQVARAVARRTERACVRYEESSTPLPTHAVQFLNRLSDFLFVAARYANVHQGEVFWKKATPAR